MGNLEKAESGLEMCTLACQLAASTVVFQARALGALMPSSCAPLWAADGGIAGSKPRQGGLCARGHGERVHRLPGGDCHRGRAGKQLPTRGRSGDLEGLERRPGVPALPALLHWGAWAAPCRSIPPGKAHRRLHQRRVPVFFFKRRTFLSLSEATPLCALPFRCPTRSRRP